MLFAICTASGYARSILDDKGKEYLLPPDVDDATIGKALLDTLVHSRFVLPSRRADVALPSTVEFDADLYDYNQVGERYKSWVLRLMEYAGCRTKGKLFKLMKNCNVEELDGSITLKPWHQDKLDSWDDKGITEADYVIISTDSSPEQIGAAIRLALSRCT